MHRTVAREPTAIPGPPPADLEAALRGFIVETFLFGGSGEALEDTTSFLERGFLDSMGVLELVAHLERTFGIEVRDEEIVPENLDSIREVAAFVRRKTGGRP